MIEVYADAEALAQGVAKWFADQVVAAPGRFSVCLSGGNTPKRIYEILGKPPYQSGVPWDKLHVFWGDERCVPSDDPRSNFRAARLALLEHVPIPTEQVHPIDGGIDPVKSALEYESTLRSFFAGQPPRFDLILLGLGENGHTASLFPHTPVLHVKDRWVKEQYVAEVEMNRITLTVPVLNQGKTVAFVVAGASKAKVLHEVREGPPDPERLPAQLIKPVSGDLRWLVDRAASGG